MLGPAVRGGGLGPPAGGLPRPDFDLPRSGNFLEIDEGTLRFIARTTGGSYHRAASADQLEQVLADLPRRVVTVNEVHELTVFLVGLGALLAVGAVATSRWWNRFS